MAATKKTPTKSKSQAGTTYDKEYADKLIKKSHDNGVQIGQQQAWSSMANFLQQRMTVYFESRQDDLAKECRDILLLIKPNIK